MIGNTFGSSDRTVSMLVNRAYPVVKEVYENLGEINEVKDNLDVITQVSQNLEDIHTAYEISDAVTTINQAKDEILKVESQLETIKTVADNTDSIRTVANRSVEIEAVVGNMEAINVVSENTPVISTTAKNITALSNIADNLPEILDAKNQAATATQQTAIARNWATSMTIVADNQYGAAYYSSRAKESYDRVIGKESELLTLSGTYYTPSVDPAGNLSWTNTGNKVNPAVVNVKGPKGDKGEPGQNYQPDHMGSLAERDQYDSSPIHTTFFDYDAGLLYVKTADGWSDGVPFGRGPAGPSANEIMMDPDPVILFDQIYGASIMQVTE